MKTRKICFLLPIIFLFLTSILFILLSTQDSFGIDVFESDKSVSMKVAASKKAFIGIDYDKIYDDVLPGDIISFNIKNNLPCSVNYKVDLSGTPIDEFTPKKFRLLPYENKKIRIRIFDTEEASEGDYKVNGDISGEFNYGKINVDFDFKISVEIPEPPPEELPVPGEMTNNISLTSVKEESAQQ